MYAQNQPYQTNKYQNPQSVYGNQNQGPPPNTYGSGGPGPGPAPNNYANQPNPSGGSFRPRPPTIRIDPQLRQWFGAVDRDNSGNISAIELQQALVNGDWSPFDLDTVKMLMNIFDTDRSGTINFDEFAGLWKYIKDWQGVFRHFDADRSGTIAGHELRNALDQFGFRLPPNLLQLLLRKYVISDNQATGSLMSRNNPDGGITFDRFVRCCVTVKSLTESFQRIDTDRDGWVQLSYEQFMQLALEAP
ncbi:hypothetical protein O181_031144 [Austropuccinia psidii MF-1]|uniref:EF-hand domain-containing protein n=1 Tax=Austropuccinia psidii MF-1 TaxID=1389203 RepID=A0A9Q3CUA0_9BASI|nr:hypothetical protein [Austropuccinia psidii MF-1]